MIDSFIGLLEYSMYQFISNISKQVFMTRRLRRKLCKRPTMIFATKSVALRPTRTSCRGTWPRRGRESPSWKSARTTLKRRTQTSGKSVDTDVSVATIALRASAVEPKNSSFGKPGFLVVSARLYMRVCPSVGRSVGWSVGRSVGRSVRRSVRL